MQTIQLRALRHSAFYSPFLMCIAGGFLKQHALQAEYAVAESLTQLNQELDTGQCHVAQSAIATAFSPQTHINSIAHFAQINQRDGFFIASRRPMDDFNWLQLRGHSVLVDHFFQPLAMFKYALHKQQIDIADVQIIDAGDVHNIERSFRNGEADFVHMQGPGPQQLQYEKQAYVVAAVGAALPPVAFSSLCAKRDWLATDMAKRFVRAYRESKRYCQQEQPAQLADLLQKCGFFQDIERKVLCDTLHAYQQLGCWLDGVAITRDSYENLLDVYQFSGLITQRPDYASIVHAPPQDI